MYMTYLLNNISEHIKENKVDDTLFVKNIIVNKAKYNNRESIYIPTQKWVMQLGTRLELNY